MSEQHSYKKMKVTPAMAAAWLEKNTFNRPLSEVRAKSMAKDMLEGNWRLSPDPIVIGKDGVLYNAQHRLRALVLSGTSQEFLVLQNADPGLRMVIDQGRSRNTAETLRFAGSDLTSHDVARLNMMARIPNGTAQVLTAFQIERMSATFSDEILWARKTFANANKITGKAAVVAGFMYAWRANPGGIGKFAAEVQEGARCSGPAASSSSACRSIASMPKMSRSSSSAPSIRRTSPESSLFAERGYCRAGTCQPTRPEPRFPRSFPVQLMRKE